MKRKTAFKIDWLDLAGCLAVAAGSLILIILVGLAL
jgi:hypothetical protein